MKTKYEFINFPSDFPIRITLKKVTNYEKDWHTLIKIIYVVEGSCNLSYQNVSCRLKKDDIILINPWTIYEINTDSELVYIEVEINMAKYGLNDVETDSYYFQCNSAIDNNHLINYKVLKSCIVGLIKVNTKYKTNLNYINNSLSYQIIYVLLEQFRVSGYRLDPKESKHFKILRRIVDYIESNYDKNLTLTDVAEAFGYTPQYFSSFFSKHMNQTFQSYYDSMRINKNFSLLESSDYPLEEVATKAGFYDYRSYIRAFKNIYKVTPNEYRKGKLLQKGLQKDFQFDTKHYLDVIFNKKIEDIEKMAATIDNIIDLDISFKDKITDIKKSFLRLAMIGRASDLLRSSTRTIIKRTQEEIGFEYLRFHGIFSDDMHLYRRFVNGEESYSFVFVDEVLDFLKSVNLKPFLELSFMPRDLARNKDKVVYESKFISSAPIDINDWLKLVRIFFRHIIDKYGFEEVVTWPISIWSEPDSTDYAFGFKDDLEFYKFYKETYCLIKSISPRLQVGSPSLIPFASWAPDWDKRFLSFCNTNDCYPDFLSIIYYANDFDFFITGKRVERISKDPDNLSKYIDYIKNNFFYMGQKIYLTQWNLTSSQRNYLNDTIYSSCYLTKNILENMDRLESFAKWSMTDFLDEAQIPNKTYHGGVGIFTYNGIAKAPYQALRFLSRLGHELLAKGNGYYVTKEGDRLQIILYNYEHYCDLYADGEYFTLKEHSRYDPFLMNKCNKYRIQINNLNYDYARIKTSRITRESGSSYDIYESMTHLEFEDKNDIIDLMALSRPKYELKEEDIINGSLSLKEKCNSLEVKLIEIKLYKKKDYSI